MKVILFSFLVPVMAFAQSFVGDPSDVNSGALTQEGRLFSIQLVKGQPLRIFVVGREEAKIDLSALTVTIRRMKPYPGKVLRTNLKDDYFVTSEPLDLDQATDIEVTTKQASKSETVRFKIDGKLP